jgi:hypothetical protein
MTIDELHADARTVASWVGTRTALESCISRRHAWRSDEAFYLVRHLRLQLWVAAHANQDPD